jgi:hypothetical protein
VVGVRGRPKARKEGRRLERKSRVGAGVGVRRARGKEEAAEEED